MKTLNLTLKKQWFDEISAGTKKIEYRDIKPFWTARLKQPDGEFKRFDCVRFRNGCRKDAPEIVVKFIKIIEKKFYEIHLGNIVS
jgi:hypothetical protein